MTKPEPMAIPRRRAEVLVRDVAARHPGVLAQEILGTGRSGQVVAARLEAYRAVAAAFPASSVCEVARVFGRHPTTLRHCLGLRPGRGTRS